MSHVEAAGWGARAHVAGLSALVRATRLVGYRGLRTITLNARRFLPDREVVTHLPSGARMHVSLADPYWIGLLDPHFRYEPEVEHALTELVTPEVELVDCGANVGYWSLMFMDRAAHTVAVEANPAVFARLQRNLRLNDAEGRVTAVERALWSAPGESVRLQVHAEMHALGALHSVTFEKGRAGGWTDVDVKTETLGTVIDAHTNPSAPLVVKLDVEGAEVLSIESALPQLRDRRAWVLYEDHGVDPTCTVTRRLIELGFEIREPMHFRPMDLAAVAASKTQTWRGYNFVARYPRHP